MNATVEKYLEPVQQLNALAVSNIEKMLEQQMKFFTDTGKIGIDQLKSAVEVKDIEGLQNYIQAQAEVAKNISERLVEDSKLAAELGAEYNTEVQKVLQEVVAAK